MRVQNRSGDVLKAPCCLRGWVSDSTAQKPVHPIAGRDPSRLEETLDGDPGAARREMAQHKAEAEKLAEQYGTGRRPSWVSTDISIAWHHYRVAEAKLKALTGET